MSAHRPPETIGVDLGGTNCRAASVTDTGEILSRSRLPTPAERSPEVVLDLIAELVSACSSEPSAVGIGFPGFLEQTTGRVRRAPNLRGWEGFPLGDEASRRLGVPVVVDNDANVAALGELRYGANRGARHAVHVTLGTGVGGALIVDGGVYRGSRGMAGEIGHIPVALDADLLCGCGQRGCLETVVGRHGFTSLMTRGWADGRGRDSELHTRFSDDPGALDLAVAADSASRGDEYAATLFAEMGSYLGRALAAALSLVDPERIVISGGLTGAWALFESAMLSSTRTHAAEPLARGVQILRSTLGDDAGVLGAASLRTSPATE